MIEKTRKKESASLSEVAWLGRTVAVKVPLVRKAITAALEQGEVVMAKVEGKKFDKKTPKQDATGDVRREDLFLYHHLYSLDNFDVLFKCSDIR